MVADFPEGSGERLFDGAEGRKAARTEREKAPVSPNDGTPRKETFVDFIERWFGVSPDGGDGSLEILYLVTLALVVCAIIFRSHVIRLISRKRPQSG